MCDDVLREKMDNVFISAIHGTQQNISAFLEENVFTILLSRSDGALCHAQINQIICKYYLSPCGNASFPSSICPEDCSAVQMKCPVAWKAAQLGLKQYHFINCNDTSAFLFPLPSCCTGVDIPDKMPPDKMPPDTMPQDETQQDKVPQGKMPQREGAFYTWW